MTTYLADQERSRRSAPGTAPEERRCTRVRAAFELSIERHPDADGGLSQADAAWPQRLRHMARASLNHWGRPHLAETAELLLTELATNALQHANGPDIRVRMYLQGDYFKITVDDGSPLRPVPRGAGLSDESGRGLFLVDALADAWGVSDDGTTTWCTLPLTKGPEEMQPVAVTAPVMRAIPIDLPGDRSGTGLARVQARTLLTVSAWPGNQHHAVDVLHALVDNAVKHALIPGEVNQRVGACLSITEAHELIIDVTDPVPLFPEFDHAVVGESGRGLWKIARKGVDLSWFVVGAEFDGKVVRAVLRPGKAEL
ncbi:ATP-binding protein [Streptomyces massasporeus]